MSVYLSWMMWWALCSLMQSLEPSNVVSHTPIRETGKVAFADQPLETLRWSLQRNGVLALYADGTTKAAKAGDRLGQRKALILVVQPDRALLRDGDGLVILHREAKGEVRLQRVEPVELPESLRVLLEQAQPAPQDP